MKNEEINNKSVELNDFGVNLLEDKITCQGEVIETDISPESGRKSLK